MQKTYDRKIIERFLNEEELEMWDKRYQKAMKTSNESVEKDSQKYYTMEELDEIDRLFDDLFGGFEVEITTRRFK